MARDVKLPQLGQTMEEGTIVNCLVEVGEKISKGDIIFEIETDKATLEMESPAEGFVKAVIAEVGQTIPVGETVLILGEENEKVDAAPAPKQVEPAQAAPAAVDKKTEAAVVSAAAVEVPASANVVRLPQLGQTMEEGTVVNCLVNIDDEVKRGDVIFEIETDKATLEMESPAGGFVKAVIAEVGQTLPVGDAVLILAEKGENISQSFIDSLKGSGPVEEASTQAAPAAAAPQVKTSAPTGKVKASPRAKKLAESMGVNLATITGTGPAGRITEKDVKAAASKPAAAAAAGSEIKLGQSVALNRLQKITGKRMLQSKQEIPCFYLTIKVDVTEMVDFRARFNKTSDVKVAYNDIIMRAVAVGIENFPIMAGQLDGESIRIADSIGVGLAISVADGLVAPIVKNVNEKSIAQIAKDSQALIEKARNNKLAPTDLEGGCITVSNLGFFGIESFIPIVVPGQCSILGIGKITETCVPDNGNILIRKLMSMTLSVDHKVANGVYAAQFLDFVRKMLEDTSRLA